MSVELEIVGITEGDPRGPNLGLDLLKEIVAKVSALRAESREKFSAEAQHDDRVKDLRAKCSLVLKRGDPTFTLRLGDDNWELPGHIHKNIDERDFEVRAAQDLILVDVVHHRHRGAFTKNNWDVNALLFRLPYGVMLTIVAGWCDEKAISLNAVVHYPNDWARFEEVIPIPDC